MGQTTSNEAIAVHRGGPGVALRAATLGGAFLAAAWWLGGISLAQGAERPEAMVAAGVLGIGALAAVWLAIGCLALLVRAVAHAAGHVPAALDRAVVRVTPRLVRRAVTLGLGAGLALGPLAGPALALEAPPPLGWQVTEGQGRPTAPNGSPVSDVVDPASGLDADQPAEPVAVAPAEASPATAGTAGADAALVPGAPAVPVPAEPAAAASASPVSPAAVPVAAVPVATVPVATASLATTSAPTAPVPAPADPAPATVVVREGDCLWTIAARHLAPGATDAQVAAAWPDWYEANAGVIGSDPDLLLPGQVLVLPQGGAR